MDVSVVIPAYKEPPEALVETIRAVSDQTYPVLEVIVVDEASPEPISLPRALQDSRVRVIRLEANKAVVAVQSGRLMEFVEEGVCGHLAGAGEADELAGAISRLIGNSDLRGRLGNEAYRRTNRFGADRLTDDIAGAMTRIALAVPAAN